MRSCLKHAFAVGLDFGTESARALIVDVRDGRIAGQASADYAHGVIDRHLPGGAAPLPADYALQHPGDWLTAAAEACRAALGAANVAPENVVGIGVAFTSCTMLPTLADGTPLCLTPGFADHSHAWPKLWKHHGAKLQTDRINQLARDRNEPWLPRYGGAVGLEWFWPKLLETLEEDPAAYAAAQVFLEAGDWLVWELTQGAAPPPGGVDIFVCPSKLPGGQANSPEPKFLVRSTCQAGYKAMWNPTEGYPSRDFLTALHPSLANVVHEKLPGRHLPPGHRAGALTPAAAQHLGLAPDTPVSAAIIDAHAGVPGSGVADAGTLVLVLGTSACHMINATAEHDVPGVAGIVHEGILPGYFGYETGQASVGDAFAWVARTLGQSHETLTQLAAALPPGSGGVLAVDWLNGCRTPLMDGRLSGAFVGLTLATRPEQLYRAMLEATAFGLRRIVETLRAAGVPVRRFVASGGLPTKSPLLMQILADVLNAEIHLAQSDQSVALGAAILGACAAGAEVTGHATVADAVAAMARLRDDLTYRPTVAAARRYDDVYKLYQQLADADGDLARTMRRLRDFE